VRPEEVGPNNLGGENRDDWVKERTGREKTQGGLENTEDRVIVRKWGATLKFRAKDREQSILKKEGERKALLTFGGENGGCRNGGAARQS